MLLEQSALEMLLAGTDTSSVTAYYALLGLAGVNESLSLQQEVRDEIRKKTEKNEDSKTPLLESLINETLPFKPVGPIVLRQAVHADDLTCLSGNVMVQQDAAILVHLAEMNMRPELWENPRVFDPRRFLNPTSQSKAYNQSKKVFFPFGDGPKGCIGMHLGRREVAAIVETVVVNYNMSIEGVETLTSLETHWDIANQPDNPAKIRLLARCGKIPW